MLAAIAALLALTGCRACVDLEAARPYPCSRDAGSDDLQCPVGWTCGLDGVCHSKEVASAYVCAQDSDCVGERWRCGPDGRCVDASLDALEPTPTTGAYRASRMGPPLLDTLPDVLAISDDFAAAD